MATSGQYTVGIVSNPLDLTPWTAAQFSSFINTDNVLHDTLFPPATPPTPAQVSVAADRHRDALVAEPEHVEFIQVVDPETGEVAGGAKWCFYPSDAHRPSQVSVTWVDDGTGKGQQEKEFAQKVMNEFHSRRYIHMTGPHALLDLCFTSPKYQRQGIASMLVQYGIDRADKEGWTSFTEASPRGRPVYARLGFEVREEVRLRWDEAGDFYRRKGDVVWYFMERPAKTTGSRCRIR